MKTVFLLGRLIFGGFFLYSGLHHFQEKKALAQYAAAKNVPLPDVAVTASGAMLMLGGASILLGVKPKIGALAIADSGRRLAHDSRLLAGRGQPAAAERDGALHEEPGHARRSDGADGHGRALAGQHTDWPAQPPGAGEEVRAARGGVERLDSRSDVSHHAHGHSVWDIARG